MKTCSRCKITKDLSCFAKHSITKDKLDYWCRVCKYTTNKEWVSKNKEKKLAYLVEYRKKNPEKFRQRIPIKTRSYCIKSKYGLSLENYENMCSVQNNICKICDLPSKLVIDHCHISGVIRGLLCSQCNSALGFFKDNENRLLKAVEYIRNARTT